MTNELLAKMQLYEQQLKTYKSREKNITKYVKAIDNFWFNDIEKNLLCHNIKEDILQILKNGVNNANSN